MTWQTGDLALCVNDAPLPLTQDADIGRLSEGNIYTVSGLFCGGWGLYLKEAPSLNRAGWLSKRFIKIDHDKPEACDPEFVILLELSKQRVEA